MTIQERINKLNERDRENNLKAAENNAASKIYERTSDEMVEPGFYTVIESDYGGMYDVEQFDIEVTESINLKDLAVRLYEEIGYRSWWNYLSIRPVRIETKVRI
jgi:hypothetical protein